MATLVLAFALLSVCVAFDLDAETGEDLNAGYRQMYNLQFEAAHQTFKRWEQLHPDDPVAPVSNAAVYLFSEFDRLKILELELFVDNEKFGSLRKQAPDAATKRAFESELARGEKIADRLLAKSSQDRDAMFAQILANGLRGDYAALIEKKNLASLGLMKSSRATAEELLKKYPTCYDAYLAIGVENYLLSLKPAPIRWLLRISGAQTNRETGLEKLRLTAEKGYYLAPYARLLLAVAALRDRDDARARELLSGLVNEFPDNGLFKKELDRIPVSKENSYTASRR